MCCNHWALGGAGALDLAKVVEETCSSSQSEFKFLYDLDISIEEKILTIAREMYGASAIEFSETAQAQANLYSSLVADYYDNCLGIW